MSGLRYSVGYQLRSAIAEKLLGWAMRLDPTRDTRVREAYRDLWRRKLAQIEREVAEDRP